MTVKKCLSCLEQSLGQRRGFSVIGSGSNEHGDNDDSSPWLILIWFMAAPGMYIQVLQRSGEVHSHF